LIFPLIYVSVQKRLQSVPCLEGHPFDEKFVPSNFIYNENVYFSLFPPKKIRPQAARERGHGMG
jgi:hypothetical protein